MARIRDGLQKVEGIDPPTIRSSVSSGGRDIFTTTSLPLLGFGSQCSLFDDLW